MQRHYERIHVGGQERLSCSLQEFRRSNGIRVEAGRTMPVKVNEVLLVEQCGLPCLSIQACEAGSAKNAYLTVTLLKQFRPCRLATASGSESLYQIRWALEHSQRHRSFLAIAALL